MVERDGDAGLRIENDSPARMGGNGSPNVLRIGELAVKFDRAGDVSEGKVVERGNEVMLDE